jgi:N-acetylmuramoyl-L-alanine amidase
MPPASTFRLLLVLLALLCLAPGGTAFARGRAAQQAKEPASAQHWDPNGPAVAIAADLSGPPTATQLVFTLSKSVEARAFVLERPDRVIVELPEVNFQIPGDPRKRRDGLVTSFRYGLFAPGRSRIVIDLAQPAIVSQVGVTSRASDGASLLTVTLARTDRDNFRKALAEAAATPLRPGAHSESAGTKDLRPVIAIDAGHGGIDPGATGPGGVVEKDIVFRFAQQLRTRLETSGRYRVVMTRDSDVFVALDDRVRRARAAKADLLISIHADTIRSRQVRGATVYTSSDQASDAESAQLADRENSADAVAGVVPQDQPEEVADILQDLTVRETRGFSHRFAGQVIGELTPMTKFNTRPHREAGFRVLRAAEIPSVLVELGYLSSAQDAGLLLSEEWRDRSSAAMSLAVDRFFATRLANGAGAPVSP